MTIDPKEIPVSKLHGYLLSAVAPRPIAFASTVDKEDNVNLSPFSFFNVFSANPPVLIFSPARRGRDKSTKHTLENVKEHAEVVVNVVSYDMVQQVSLSSTEYDKGVNEFLKVGFTEMLSERVKPPRVKEAPVSFECKVTEVKSLGEQGGAGQLVICEILLMHISDHILDNNKKIDPNKIDLVGRMGGDWYCRTVGNLIFEVVKPLTIKGIGVDQIPDHIRISKTLTGNHLGMLGNVEALPSEEEIRDFENEPEVKSILNSFDDEENIRIELHKLAIVLLNKGEVNTAWKVLMMK